MNSVILPSMKKYGDIASIQGDSDKESTSKNVSFSTNSTLIRFITDSQHKKYVEIRLGIALHSMDARYMYLREIYV